MPRLPMYQRQTSDVGLVSSVPGTKNMVTTGDVVSGIAEQATKTFEAIEVSNLTAQMADFNVKMQTRFNEYQRRASPNPVDENSYLSPSGGEDWEAQFQKEYNEELSKIGQNISTFKGQKYFNEQSGAANRSFFEATVNAKQKLAGDRAVLRHQKQVQSYSISAYNNPGNLDQLVGSYEKDLQAMVDAGAVTPVAAEQLKLKTRPELAAVAVNSEIDKNPYATRAALLANKYDAYLDGDMKADLVRRADAKISQKQNEQANIEALRQPKPWEFLGKIGERPPSIDMRNPDSFVDRYLWLDQMKKKHGIIDMEILAPQEIDTWARVMKTQNVDETVGVFAQMDLALNKSTEQGINAKALVGRALFAKEPSLSVAFSISASDPETAKSILRGSKLAESKAVGIPKETEDSLDKAIPPGMFAHIPEAGGAIRKAAIDYMVGKLSVGNEPPKDYSTSDVVDAKLAIIGPSIFEGGKEIPTFRSEKTKQFVEPDQFNTLLRSLNTERLEKLTGDYPTYVKDKKLEPVDLSAARYQLFVVRDGVYRMYDRKEGKFFVSKKTGGPFELNLKKYEKGYEPLAIQTKRLPISTR